MSRESEAQSIVMDSLKREQALKRLEKKFTMFTFQLGFADLYMMIHQLTIAFRYPANRGYGYEKTREMILKIVAALGDHEPELAASLKRDIDQAQPRSGTVLLPRNGG